MVNRRMGATTAECNSTQKRTAVAEFPRAVRNPNDAYRQVLFFQAAGTPVMKRKEVADIVLAGNRTVSSRNVLLHMRLQLITFNEKGNLSGLLVVAVTSSIIKLALKETFLTTARRVDPAIIDGTGDKM